MVKTADYWKKQLQLEKHPEGGFYKRIYESGETLDFPARVGLRPYATAIYYLLEGSDVSKLHRLKSDELWHFYYGSALTLHMFDAAGNYFSKKLGDNPEVGAAFCRVVKAGMWFGASVDEGDYTLSGCTLSPGFDFSDFEMGDKKALLELYPQHCSLIQRLT